MRIVEFSPAHADMIVVQRGQHLDATGPVAWAATRGPAWTAINDGRVIAIAGLAENHAQHATAWAVFAEDKRQAMVPVTRACARLIAAARYRRVDMIVRCGFDRAHDFASLLGFRVEATLCDWFPDGSDALMYRRADQ